MGWQTPHAAGVLDNSPRADTDPIDFADRERPSQTPPDSFDPRVALRRTVLIERTNNRVPARGNNASHDFLGE